MMNLLKALPEMLWPSLLGACVTIAANGALLYAAYLVAARLFPNERTSVKFAAFGLLSAWLVVVVSTVLLVTHTFNRPAMVGVSLIVAGIAWRLCRGYGGSPGRDYQHIRSFVADQATGPSCGMWCVVLFAVLFQVVRGLMLPPLAWDSFTYHMPLAGLWVQHGGYAPLPGTDACHYYNFFQHNGEAVFSWLMLPFSTDLLVNVGNMPFLFLGALSVYALGRELDVDRSAALLAAGLTISAPPFFAYVTTQYVDVQVLAEVLAGVFFLVRFCRKPRGREAILAFIGFGLAAGTKLISLQVMALAALVTFGVMLGRRKPIRTIVGILAGVCLIGGACMATWYVRNWVLMGSPFYPFSLVVGKTTILTGSPVLQATLSSLDAPAKSIGYLAPLAFLLRLCVFAETPPLTYGPALFVAAAGAFAALIAAARSRNRWLWLLLLAIIASEFLQFFGEGMRSARVGWPLITCRYLMLSYSLMLVACAYGLSRLGRMRLVFTSIGCALLVWHVTLTNPFIVDSHLAKLTHAAWLLGVVGAISAFALILSHFRPKAWQVALFLILLIIVAVPFIQTYRDTTRQDRFCHATDLHWVARRAARVAWRKVDMPDEPFTIAVTAGWGMRGHNWFLYPLMGRRLQNQLVYVSPSRTAEVSYAPDLDDFPRLNPDE
ncbi:MAG: hypothetical protein E4H02_09450, partial [Lentisphaerales bacterium]